MNRMCDVTRKTVGPLSALGLNKTVASDQFRLISGFSPHKSERVVEN